MDPTVHVAPPTEEERAKRGRVAEPLALKRRRCARSLIVNERSITQTDPARPITSAKRIKDLSEASEGLLVNCTDADLDKILEYGDKPSDPETIGNGFIDVGLFDTPVAGEIYSASGGFVAPAVLFKGIDLQRGRWVGIALLSAVLHHNPFQWPATPQDTDVVLRRLMEKYERFSAATIMPIEFYKAATRRLEDRVYLTKMSRDFFSMKTTQSPLDITKPSVFSFRQACPLWNKYDNGRVLSSGAFGITILYTRRDELVEADTLPLQFVVKIQVTKGASNEDANYDAALRELIILAEFTAATRSWPSARKSSLHNHVILYDWVRCDMDLAAKLRPVLSADDFRVHSKHLKPGVIEDYQIMVEEFVPDGTLEAVVRKNRFAAEGFASTNFIAGMYAQIFGSLYRFYARGFTHNDLKPANVLLERVPPSSRFQYLLYRIDANGPDANASDIRTLWVPLRFTRDFLLKPADFGLSVMRTASGQRVGNPRHRIAPGLDVEVFTMWLMASAAQVFKQDYMTAYEPGVYIFFRSLIAPASPADTYQFKKDENTGELYPPSGFVRDRAIELLSDDRIGRPAPNWREDHDIFLLMYNYAQKWWRFGPYAQHMGVKAIDYMFGQLSTLRNMEDEPEDADETNAIYMNNYDVVIPIAASGAGSSA